MSYTPEEKELLKAARLLKKNCDARYCCDDCIFDTEDGCVLVDGGVPGYWDIISEEEEGY